MKICDLNTYCFTDVIYEVSIEGVIDSSQGYYTEFSEAEEAAGDEADLVRCPVDVLRLEWDSEEERYRYPNEKDPTADILECIAYPT